MRKKFNNITILIAIVLALFSPAQGQSAVQAKNNQVDVELQSDGSEIPTDRIIIKYKDGTSASFAPALAPQMDRVSVASATTLEYLREMSVEDVHVLELPERLPVAEVEAIAQQLEALPEVEYAEPDRIYTVAIEPDDPLYDNPSNDQDQWHFHQTWGINLPAAWDITTGSTSVIVAVVDTGITDHPELANRTVPGYDFTDMPEANDGDGRDSDPEDPGDWVTPAENASGPYAGCAVTNSTWHGTHVAGLIGAQTDNTAGVAGIDWSAKILPVRVLGKCGGYMSDIADGMRWAAGLTVSGVPANANPAHIINLSLGIVGACGTTEQNAITEIVEAGVVVVAAAGNTNTNVNNYSPANCVGVISVAATDINGNKASYSNFGSGIEISAPGGDSIDGVLSTSDTGLEGPVEEDYEEKYGTSMAAPHVSGVLALMFSVNPGLTPDQALQILQNTATAFPNEGSCNTTICGSGIVNAAAAVAMAEAPDLIITGFELVDLGGVLLPSDPEPNEAFGIRVVVKNRGGTQTDGVFYRSVYINRDPLDTNLFEITTPDGCLYNLDTEENDRGDYTKPSFISSLPAGATDSSTIVEISNPETAGFPPAGLPAGTYQIWLYVDPTCIVDNESFEGNNAYGPFTLTVGEGASACTIPTGNPPVFADVPNGYWAKDYIEAMYYCGYTAGCSTGSPLLFCPETSLDRGQSAVFILRGNFGTSYNPPPAPWTTFKDNFSPGPWAQGWVQGLFNAGMTAGCSSVPMLYCPWEKATREQLAVFGLRLKYGSSYFPPAPTGTVFADMPNASYWANGWTEQAYIDGLILSCGTQGGKPLFCPSALVSRASASYTIVKAKNLLP